MKELFKSEKTEKTTRRRKYKYVEARAAIARA